MLNIKLNDLVTNVFLPYNFGGLLIKEIQEWNPDLNRIADDEIKHAVSVRLDDLAEFYEKIGATSSKSKTIRINQRLREYLSYWDIYILLFELGDQFRDELKDWQAILLSTDESALYADGKRDRYGDDVLRAFPSASLHAAEACKCYALNRWTACTYHCIGVIECGIKALCKELNAEVDFEKSELTWEKMINAIEKQLTPQRDGSSGVIKPAPRKVSHPDSWHQDEGFFRAIIAELRSIQRGFRNPTMHFRIVYPSDRDQAQALLTSSASFLRLLSRKVRE